MKLISAKRKRVLQVLSLLVVRATASLGSLVVIYFVAQVYGESGVAEISMLIATSIGISIFSRFGLDLAGIKLFPGFIYEGQYGKIKTLVIYFILRTAVMQSAVLAIFCFSYNGVVNVDSVSLIVCSVSCSVLALCSVVAKSSLMPVRSSFYEVGYFLLLSSVLLVFTRTMFGDSFSVQRIVALSAALYVTMAFCYMAYITKMFWRSRRRELDIPKREINKQCFDFTLINASGYLYSYGYIWLSGVILLASEVAAAGVLSRVVFAINFSVMIANSIYNPKYAISISAGSFDKVEEYAARSLKLMLAISLPPFMLIVFFPGEVYGIFSIDAGTPYKLALIIMAVAQLVNVITGNAAAILNLSGFQHVVRNNSIIHALLGILLAYVCGSLYGLLGLVLSISLVLASQNIILVAILYRKAGVNIYKKVFA